MKNFYIVVNEDKENAGALGKRIQDALTKRGCSARLSDRIPEDGVPDGTECIVTLGGDGTLIRAARSLDGKRIPLVGINLGGLGYLTQVGRGGNVEELLDALCENRFEVQDRMMLKGTVYKNGKKAAESAALNDIVVSREGRLRILKLRIYVDGRFLNEYSADGMIVSTPTGSTAYNLSAGGPIAQPDGQLMILTPVCPHTLTSRAIIFGPESRIRIEIPETAEGGQTAAFDGDLVVKLSGGDYLEITRAETAVRVLRLDNRSFLDILKDKMYEA